MDITESQPETLLLGNIDWKSYSELVITPEMENYTVLLWVEQKKLCRLHVPRVITGDIVDGKVKICYSHKLTDRDWSLSQITHYAWLNEPE
jgi:hypothetical protein